MTATGTATINQFSLCPCHSQVLYDGCCSRFHQGARPDTALELMRSRYCAYVLGLADYIIETTHRKNPCVMANKRAWRKDILDFCQTTQFEALTILEFIDGDRTASITFSVKLKPAGKENSFTEKSSFLCEGGRWLYRSGALEK